jgi:hypothetical protein
MIGALPPLQGCLYSRDSKPPTPTASRGSWAILRLDASAPCGGAASLRIVLTRMIQNGRPSGARHRHARYGSLSGGLASLAGVLTAPERTPEDAFLGPTGPHPGRQRKQPFGVLWRLPDGMRCTTRFRRGPPSTTFARMSPSVQSWRVLRPIRTTCNRRSQPTR